MRKIIAGLMIGVLALGSAAGAVAATAVPFSPLKPVEFGQLNNRAVLGLAAAQDGDEGEGTGTGGNSTLPVIIGVSTAAAVGIGIAVASGGNNDPVTPSSP